MAGLYYIICIAFVIGVIYRAIKRRSAQNEQNKANAAFLGENQSASNLDEPCRIRVYLDKPSIKSNVYYFSLNGSEKQPVHCGEYIEFQTSNELNVLDGFGGGNGFAGSSFGIAVDSYQFKATSGGFIQLFSNPNCIAFDAGLACFVKSTWQNNISEHKHKTDE